MVAIGEHHVKRNKLHIERQISHVIPCLRANIKKHLEKTQKQARNECISFVANMAFGQTLSPCQTHY